MSKKITKRDGKIVNFNPLKIYDACLKAAESIKYIDAQKLAFSITANIVSKCDNNSNISITVIQKSIENELMDIAPDVAREFIQYRHDRDTIRAKGSELHAKLMGLIEMTDDGITTENANKDTNVFPVMRDLMAGIVSKQFAGNFIPKKILAAHMSGDIHYHDLDYSPFLPFTNCCLVDLKGMLTNGFRLGNAQIESPKSIGVACAVTSQIIAQVASHQYGGTTIPNIDQTLAPYVIKSYNKNLESANKYNISNPEQYAREHTEKETYDGMQACEYEINTLFSANGQQPFVTFSFGMGTSWEERIIQESILKIRIKGLGKEGITAVFPKLVFFLEEGLNLKPEDPNYDIKQLALECTSKRIYPDIISTKLNKEITGSSVPVSPMGCRSFLSVWKDEYGNEILDGRNNLGVISLNLPRVAIESHGNFEKFNKILDKRLKLCFDALMTRIERFKGVKAKVAPILYTEGAFGVRLNPEDDIISLLTNDRSSISLGFIGLHEVGLLMFGDHPFDNKDCQDFLQTLIQKMKETTIKWKKETGFGFSLYATPSESLCNRFCKLDKERYGVIKDVTDKGYYTNSFHLDVFKKVNPFEKIDFEKGYAWNSSGGNISYVELPNMVNNLKGLERIWDYAMQYVPYFGTNTPVDSCGKCGFKGETVATEEGFTCPTCGNTDSSSLSVTRRVCGYLGSPNARPFNKGKQKEVMCRTKHLNYENKS